MNPVTVLEDRLWLARVLDVTGEVVGAAFAVDEAHLVTCAHVADAAGAAGPGATVEVDMPKSGARGQAEVLAEGYAPAVDGVTAGDVAVLRITQPPDGLCAVRLRSLRSLDRLAFAAYGFPDGLPDGVWVRGSLGLTVGAEWVQLEPDSARKVAPGFSGTPVWSEAHQAVVGMMVARDQETAGGVAFAIPVSILARGRAVVQSSLPTALELDPAARSHWDVRARGVAEGDAAWLFTGRRRALTELVAWLTSREPPAMRVITGPPGCGKSAVLARLATTSDRRYRQRMPALGAADETVAPVGVIDATFHAKDRTVRDFVAHIADVCNLDGDDTAMLSEAVGQRSEPLVVVVDALDEATEPRPLATLLHGLARRGCRVLVGCRPHLADRLGDPSPMRLDEPPYMEAGDVELYAQRCLVSALIASEDDASEVAADIAAAAAGNFLVAQLVADGVGATGEVVRPFPTTVADALQDRLDRLPEPDATRELLLPLAYAFGDGLPENLWLSGASALSREYQRGDVRRLLSGPARSFLVAQPTEDGERYRLFHQALADTLTAESDPSSDQQALWQTWQSALSDAGDGRVDWAGAPEYLRQHAPDHAAAAGELQALADDADYLIAGDLYRLRVRLREINGTEMAATAALLGLTAARAQGLDADGRAALLALAARHLGLARTAEVLLNAYSQQWSPVWAHTLGPPHDVLEGHTDAVSAVAFGRIGGHELLASSSWDHTVRLWDPVSGQPVGKPLSGHTGWVTAVAFGRVGDRDLLASASDDKTVRLWDPAAGQPVGDPLSGHSERVTAVAFARVGDRDLLATASNDRTVRLWDPAAGQPVGDPLTGHGYWVNAVAFGRVGDRNLLASASGDITVRLWDPVSGEPVGDPLTDHGGRVNAVAFGRVGERDLLASAADDDTVRLWDPVGGKPLGEPLSGHTGSVSAVAFGRVGDRDLLASASGDDTVRLWDPVSGQSVGEPLTGHGDRVTAVAFAQIGDRDLLVSSSDDSTVRVWDPAASQRVGNTLTGHSSFVTAVAFGRVGDRDLLASASDDKTVRLWDPASGQPVGDPLAGHSDRASAVAFGRVGARDVLASASNDRTVRLWDPTSGQPVGDPLSGHSYPVSAVTFGRVGDREVLASSSDDGTVRLWDPTDGQPVGDPLTGHSRWVRAVAFVRVGNRDVLASASDDRTVRLWDPASGEPVGDPLTGHTGPVTAVAFGCVGGRDLLVSASDDNTVRVWDPATATEVVVFRTLAPARAVALSANAIVAAAGRALCLFRCG